MSYAQEDNASIMSSLFEISFRGSVSELNTLIQRNPLILYRLSLTTSTETPLHISSMLGHVDLTKSLLIHKPQLALELDYSGRTPLHLASAEGHKEIVEVLLHARDGVDACMKTDHHQGKIPLHYAAMRGRTEIVKDLIVAKPESLIVLDGSGKSILHLCVEHNHLETLKTLVKVAGDDHHRPDFLNFRDSYHGNTILHLAVILKQIETVRYLLSIPIVREEANIRNNKGYNPLDMVEHSPRDFRSLQIQVMLMDTDINHPQSQPPTTTGGVRQVNADPNENNLSKFLEHMDKFLQSKGVWLEQMRGMLSVVAIMISSVTFNVVTNLPDALKDKLSNTQPVSNQTSGIIYSNAKTVPYGILGGVPAEERYMTFLVLNSISFVASLGLTLLLISGVPLKNRFIISVLSIFMCTTLSFLVFAYALALLVLVPSRYVREYGYWGDAILVIWMMLLWFIILFTTIRLVLWVIKKLKILRHISKLALWIWRPIVNLF